MRSTSTGDGGTLKQQPLFNRIAILRTERQLSRLPLADAVGVNYAVFVFYICFLSCATFTPPNADTDFRPSDQKVHPTNSRERDHATDRPWGVSPYRVYSSPAMRRFGCS